MKLLMSSKKKIKVIKIKSKKEIYLKIIQLIKKSLKKNNSLMIAGGKTYLNFYKFLSKKLNINSINILLTDERLSKNILRTNNMFYKYIQDVDSSNQIYEKRWGDLPLWGEVIDYILGTEYFFIDNTFKYYHGSHNIDIN